MDAPILKSRHGEWRPRWSGSNYSPTHKLFYMKCLQYTKSKVYDEIQGSSAAGGTTSSSSSSSRRVECEEEEEEDVTLCLPDELLENIFVFLPISHVFRARAVCIRWNIVSSSTWFLSAYRSNKKKSTTPWYFMFKEPHTCDGWLYDPGFKTWYSFSLPCANILKNKSSSWVVASSNGLACFAENYDDDGAYPRLYICNPMTKSWKSLPVPFPKWCPLQTLYNYYKYAMSMRVDKITGERTTVVARSTQIRPDDYTRWDLTVEVCKFSATQSSSWQTLVTTILDGWRGGEDSVICNGIFYCVIHSTAVITSSSTAAAAAMVPVAGGRQGRHALLLCELATGKVRTPFVLMPTSLTCVRLINCREKMIMVGGIGKTTTDIVISGIGVWEVDKDAEWRRVSMMPEKLFRAGFNSELDDVFSCSGAGDLIYMHGYGSPQLVLFDVKQRSWHWSHRCPSMFLKKPSDLHIFTGFCFEPCL